MRALVVLAVLALSGCGAQQAAAKPTPTAATTTATATPSPSATVTESASCQRPAQEFVDRYRTIGEQTDGDVLDLDTLRSGATKLYALYDEINHVCSPKLQQAAANANYETSLAVMQLTVCGIRPSKCSSMQDEAGTHIINAIQYAVDVNKRLHPAQ